jgi:ribosomal protein S19/nucleotide-binding universal stress UspA family protein
MSDKDIRPVKNRLLKAVAQMNESEDKKVIRTHDRHVNIKSDFVGLTFAVFNGRKFVRFSVNESMVGKKLGDFAPKVAPTAQLMYSGIPARKMRLVAALIKGKPVERALNILNFTSRYAALPLAKMLKSAVANKLSIEGTAHLHPEDLYVKEIAVHFPGLTDAVSRAKWRDDPEANAIMSLMLKLGEERGVAVLPVYAVSEDAAATILDLSATLGVDYLFIGASQRNVLAHLLRGSVVTSVAEQLPDSIELVIHG